MILKRVSILVCGLAAISVGSYAQGTYPTLGNCPMLPANNVWNTRVDNLPVHPMSSTWISQMMTAGNPLHPDFGSDPQNGYLFNQSHSTAPAANVTVVWPFTSDPGPYPIASNTQVENPSDPNNDHHFIVEDTDNCHLWEAFGAVYSSSSNSWNIDAISNFDLNSNALKPANWSSGNAGGTAILPGLVRYDEMATNHIDHAIIMTSQNIANYYVWPASHTASSLSGSQYPPMGTRLRLKANVDISGFGAIDQTILMALKTYGAILTDNGADFHISGLQDNRWNDGDLHNLTQLNGSNFEVVDESSLEISAASGQVTPRKVPQGWQTITNVATGECMQPVNAASTQYMMAAPCTGTVLQQWQFIPVAGGYNQMKGGTVYSDGNFISWTGSGYTIINRASGQSLAVPDASTKPNTQLDEYWFYPQAHWVWAVAPSTGGNYFIQNYNDGQVMQQEGGVVMQNYITSYASPASLQLWKLTPAN